MIEVCNYVNIASLWNEIRRVQSLLQTIIIQTLFPVFSESLFPPLVHFVRRH